MWSFSGSRTVVLVDLSWEESWFVVQGLKGKALCSHCPCTVAEWSALPGGGSTGFQISVSKEREHLHNLEGCSPANIARVCRLQRYSLDLYVNVFPLVLLWNLVEGVLAGSGHKLFKMHSSLYGTQKIINVQVEKSLGTNAALFTDTPMFPCMPLAYQMALLTSVSRSS